MAVEIQKTALRLPKDIHTAIVESAEKSDRTMNAEIIFRLRETLLAEDVNTKIITADEARILMSSSYKNILNSLRKLTTSEISKSIDIGKPNAYIDLSIYAIDDPEELIMKSIIEPFIAELEGLGYSVKHLEVEGFFVHFGEEDIKKAD